MSTGRSNQLRLLAVLALAAVLGGGCQTAVGNYFANRTRDLGECFRAQASAGLGIGATIRAAGIVDTGLQIGWRGFPGIGWRYGEPVLAQPPGAKSIVGWPIDGTTDFEASLLAVTARNMLREQRPDNELLVSYALLPALFTFDHGSLRGGWIWGPIQHAERHREDPLRARRWWRVHAFDTEVSVMVGVVGVTVGFSPGEFVDFLLGWFGVDIAGDDTEWKPTPTR